MRPAILLDESLSRWAVTRGYVENVAATIAMAVVNSRAVGRTYNVADSDALPAGVDEGTCQGGRVVRPDCGDAKRPRSGGHSVCRQRGPALGAGYGSHSP